MKPTKEEYKDLSETLLYTFITENIGFGLLFMLSHIDLGDIPVNQILDKVSVIFPYIMIFSGSVLALAWFYSKKIKLQ